MDREQVLAMLKSEAGDLQLAPVIDLVESDGTELQRLTDDVARLNGEVETLRTAQSGNVEQSVKQALSLQERALKAESELGAIASSLGCKRTEIGSMIDEAMTIRNAAKSDVERLTAQLGDSHEQLEGRKQAVRDRIIGYAELVDGAELDKAGLTARLSEMGFDALDAELEAWSVKLRESYQTPSLIPEGKPQTEFDRALDLSGYRV